MEVTFIQGEIMDKQFGMWRGGGGGGMSEVLLQGLSQQKHLVKEWGLEEKTWEGDIFAVRSMGYW